jgi:biopolymer transport protein ExbB/TolQ
MKLEKLNIKEQELEARLGFHPGKFTNPNQTLAFILATLACAAFYGVLHFLSADWQQSRFVAIFTERGVIPYITTFGFLWGWILVWIKGQKAATQASALTLLLDRNFGCYRFTPQNAHAWHRWLDRQAEKPQDYLLLNRLRVAFSTLGNMGQPATLPDVLNHHAETDELQVDGSYSSINMLLFALPILGFIGTVLGLGSAIGGFGQTLSVGTENLDGLIGSLQGVAGGLSVAFDTTLLALICTLILQIYASYMRSRETAFLEDCNTFMQNEFSPNLRNESEPNEAVPWNSIGGS